MAGTLHQKRKAFVGTEGGPRNAFKKSKRQNTYDSSSKYEIQEYKESLVLKSRDNDEGLEALEITPTAEAIEGETDVSSDSGGLDATDVTDASDSEPEDENSSKEISNPNMVRKRKRNDPEAFATSISKILGAKLSSSKRSDPVLSRSVTALQASKEISDRVLEKKAKHKLREDKRLALEKGRVKDVLGVSATLDSKNGDESPAAKVSEITETERRLRKTAQRGVVKLFNAVRVAQIKGEEASREARRKGVVGYGRREGNTNEMSKKGFLDLIAGRGGTQQDRVIEGV